MDVLLSLLTLLPLGVVRSAVDASSASSAASPSTTVVAAGLVFAVAAQVPQVATVLYHRDAQGLSLSALCEYMFSACVALALLGSQTLHSRDTNGATAALLPADHPLAWPIAGALMLLIAAPLALIISISTTNPPERRWPRLSLFVIAATALSTLVILAPVLLRTPPNAVLDGAQHAVACCAVFFAVYQTVQTWYFNYKWKRTRRMSKVSQAMQLAAPLLLGLLRAALAPAPGQALRSLLSPPEGFDSWLVTVLIAFRCFMHAQILRQIRASDARDAELLQLAQLEQQQELLGRKSKQA